MDVQTTIVGLKLIRLIINLHQLVYLKIIVLSDPLEAGLMGENCNQPCCPVSTDEIF